MEPWSGRIVEPGFRRASTDDLVIAEIARSTTTFAAAVELCESGFGYQASMLNRSLFEGMAIAHWIHVNGELAAETFERAGRFERHLTASLVDDLGWADGVSPRALRAARIDRAELNSLQREFGRHGSRLWTGLTLFALVKEIETEWHTPESRMQLWQYFKVVHRDKNHRLHSSVSALVDTVVGQDERGRKLRVGPSEDHVKEALWSAHWCHANLFALAIDRFGLSDKAEFDDMIQRHQADLLLDELAMWDGVERNDTCLCGSGKKYKRCHLDVVTERHRYLSDAA